MKKIKFSAVLLFGIMVIGCSTKQSSDILLVNHVGYSEIGEKKLVLQTTSEAVPETFSIFNKNDEKVFDGKFNKGGKVDNWHTGNAFVGIFDKVTQPGKFYAKVDFNGTCIQSTVFEIKENNIAQKSLPLLLQGLKSIHPAQKYEDWDSNIPFHGSRKDSADVHGGWYDASGDYSKYLSHLTYTNFMMPQQTPLVTYNLLASAEYARQKGNIDASLLDEYIKESAYGADFLVRMQDAEGYFYTIVFDTWSKDPTRREICAYETQNGTRTEDYMAAFREGAGISIAALAKLSAAGISGEYNAEEYLATAEKGFTHLLKNNLNYCDNGVENIIDDYCALLAATELYNATEKPEYLEHARIRAENINLRISKDNNYEGWFRADEDGTRPYFHAAEAGYPIIALSRYLDFETIDENRANAIETIQQSVAFQLSINKDVYNPFGYPRQYVKAVNEDVKRAAFFIPHENESGYWYQGENARLASLAAAFNISKNYMLPEQQTQVSSFVQNQINWILGLNPFNICMLDGLGHNNPEYLEPHDWNYVGGIANGITAGVGNETDIAFLPNPQKDDSAQRWRWPEQWIPHAGWFMLAVTTIE